MICLKNMNEESIGSRDTPFVPYGMPQVPAPVLHPPPLLPPSLPLSFLPPSTPTSTFSIPLPQSSIPPPPPPPPPKETFSIPPPPPSSHRPLFNYDLFMKKEKTTGDPLSRRTPLPKLTPKPALDIEDGTKRKLISVSLRKRHVAKFQNDRLGDRKKE